MDKKKAKAVIVGGSVAGVSCAHELVLAGFDVVIIEKSPASARGSPAGAGLGLDASSVRIITSWLPRPDLLAGATVPVAVDQEEMISAKQPGSDRIDFEEGFVVVKLEDIEVGSDLLNVYPFFRSPEVSKVVLHCCEINMTVVNEPPDQYQIGVDCAFLVHGIGKNQVTDVKNKVTRTLTRDESFNCRAAHWSELHGLLCAALPEDIFRWGHIFLSFSISNDKRSVTVKAKVLETDEVVEIVGDLLVAADGCLSSVRRSFLPDLKLRYSGYCAWRGVVDFSTSEESETIIGIRRAYPELGKTVYFDLGLGTHAVLYELSNKRLNWLWYVNQPQPQLMGNSVTMKVSSNMIQKMHQEAEKTWVPELANLMKETKEPFLNVIYDSDPLQRICFDNVVVLVGDAAHPTTPHGLRSTNMSVTDAAVLGKCVKSFGVENLSCALEEYQAARVPVTSRQVLHSRKMGRIKQGLVEGFDPRAAGLEDCWELQQKNMPFFGYDVEDFNFGV